MDKGRMMDLKRKVSKIRAQGAEYAKTPEGRELGTRMEFAANLLKTLKAKKLTQSEFCRIIDMKTPQFSRIIQGNENITINMITRIADGLGVHPGKLLKAPRKTRETVTSATHL